MSQDRPEDSRDNSSGPLDTKDPRTVARPPSSSPVNRGFTLQPGGRNSIADTAERIGSAVGAAHRQVRRSLELVRPGGATSNAGQSNLQEMEPDLAARMMQAIDEEVAEVRYQAAHRFDQVSGLAETRFQQLRNRLRQVFSRTNLRDWLQSAEFPVSTVVIAVFCLAAGVTILLRNSHRR